MATSQKQSTSTKKRDRIGVILYYIYVAVLVVGALVTIRIACIQWFWKPEKDIERFFLPPSVRRVIEPDRGTIFGCDGKILAMSTPVYQHCP